MQMDGIVRPDMDPEQRYRYNGKELDEATGLYDYGARYYDPAIGRFPSIDRFADKFAYQSPYVYAGNNPILFIDVNGDSLDVGGNMQLSFDDVSSMLKNKDRDRASYDPESGRVSFNTEGLKRNKDGELRHEGARVLEFLVTAEEKYLYSQTHSHGVGLAVARNAAGPYRDLTQDEITSLNTSGLVGQTVGEGPMQFAWFTNTSVVPRGDESSYEGIYTRPSESSGYHSIVTISPGDIIIRSQNSSGGSSISTANRSGFVRHELAEAYYRTSRRQSYERAHQNAGPPREFYQFNYK